MGVLLMSLLCLSRICSPNQSGSHDIAGNNDKYQLQLTQAMAYSTHVHFVLINMCTSLCQKHLDKLAQTAF